MLIQHNIFKEMEEEMLITDVFMPSKLRAVPHNLFSKLCTVL